MYFDSHVHFETLDGEHGIDALVSRAAAAGVHRILAVGGNPAMNTLALDAAGRYPDTVQAAIGWDRGQASGTTGSADPRAPWNVVPDGGVRPVALGEIGLDYHYAPETAAAQRGLMRAQLAIAREMRLPVIVHSRDAEPDTLELLEEHRAAWSGNATPGVGVLHCFTGNADFARRLLALDFLISFSGIVTFGNADALRRVAIEIPESRLLIETDTPYLAPVPHRGKPNEPAFLPAIAGRLAALRGVSTDHLAATTHANAVALFGPR